MMRVEKAAFIIVAILSSKLAPVTVGTIVFLAPGARVALDRARFVS